MILINKSKNPQICKTYVLQPNQVKDIPDIVAKQWLKEGVIEKVEQPKEEIKEEILEIAEVEEVKPKKKAKSKK